LADPVRARSVYRYFDLADSFVRILVLEPGCLRVDGRLGLNRAGYRRLILGTCMPDLGEDVEQALVSLFPDDPLLVEDLLYQLCVEVNPELDIHEVRITVERDQAAPRRAPQGEGRSEAGGDSDRLARLRRRLRGLDRRLSDQVIGQREAVAAVMRAVRRTAAGLSSDRRPLTSLLFAGRTGTGKTELARCLAREVFTREGVREIVRIDCSEFALAHEYAKLIGSPPGYVGHEHGGQLTEALSQNPECVVLFDEVEKAHPRMHNLLLQILEEGSLTDGKGRRMRFDRSIVIMTSNAGAIDFEAASIPVGFHGERTLVTGSLREITRAALERCFAP
jgi:hypothetical protein